MSGTSRRLVGVLVVLGSLAAPAWAADGGAPGSTEGSYVVKPGDTLWRIAGDVLKDPSRWRAVWEENRFITDPNRIFPGDTLALPGGRPAPPPAAAAAPEVPVPAEPPKAEAKPEAPVVEAQAPPPPAPVPTPGPAPPLAAQLPPVPPASPYAVACSPVLAADMPSAEIGIGSLVQSEEDRLLLSMEDPVFVGLSGTTGVRVGDRLAVVRPGTRLAHPLTRRPLGRVLHTLGILEVREVRDRVLKARIAYSCDSMHLGDRVAPLQVTPLPEWPATAQAFRSVEGVVVASPRSDELLALQQLVFLDVGASQGIKSGDVFAVYRPHLPAVNPTGGAAFPIPPERLGEAVVVRVTPDTATAVLTASRKESHAGDRVILSREVQP
ncbi:MAG: LysM peptidoglycan-binding domain-containing protein [Candidatus Methylomirabilales bacterium]